MTASEQIDNEIASLTDWRGPLMAKFRALIKETAPDITEEWKWNTPIYSQNGLVCGLGAFKQHVKLNFMKGASLPDPQGLFNAGFDAKTSRSIDFREGDPVNEDALREMIRGAIALNPKKGK